MARFKEEGKGKKEEGNRDKFSVKFRKLPISIRKVLIEAIEFGGSTMDDGLYQHVGGESGSYWSRRRVYDRAGQPCRRPACCRAGSVIQKTVIAHRSTYFCPTCQKR
jgi:formamidopyrimidine-DNA glycosylase